MTSDQADFSWGGEGMGWEGMGWLLNCEPERAAPPLALSGSAPGVACVQVSPSVELGTFQRVLRLIATFLDVLLFFSFKISN